MFIVGNQYFRFLVQASQAFGRVVGAKNRSGRSCACQQHYCEFHPHGLIVLYRELCEHDFYLSWGEGSTGVIGVTWLFLREMREFAFFWQKKRRPGSGRRSLWEGESYPELLG